MVESQRGHRHRAWWSSTQEHRNDTHRSWLQCAGTCGNGCRTEPWRSYSPSAVARSTTLLCSSGATLHSTGIDPGTATAAGSWESLALATTRTPAKRPSLMSIRKIGSRRSSLNSPAQSEHATAIKAAYPQVSVPSSLHLVCDAPPHPSKAASRLATVRLSFRLSSGTFEALAHVAVVVLTCADATRGTFMNTRNWNWKSCWVLKLFTGSNPAFSATRQHKRCPS